MASQVGQLPPLPPSRPLPVINLGRLSKDPATRALAIQDTARACREQGCFQVTVCCFLAAPYSSTLASSADNEL